MKKTFLLATMLLSSLVMGSYNDANAITITVTYSAGKACGGSGSNCTITVKYDFLVAAPQDVDPVNVPAGYELATIKTDKWDLESFNQPALTFSSNQTSDGSTISVPAQEYQYSRQLGAWVVFARRQ